MRALFLLIPLLALAADWKPAPAPLSTRWAAQVNPAQPLPEYPRPQLVRDQWSNLNGLWQFAVTTNSQEAPRAWEGQILVPFPLESSLSGVKRTWQPGQTLWYRRDFEVPAAWRGRRVLLHFGAVDWDARVTLNGQFLGEHKGGYTPFSFDLTPALVPGPRQTLTVAVQDPTDTWTQPRGKQVSDPRGIWYTSVTGIWQTVWLEPVAPSSLAALVPVPDLDNKQVTLSAEIRGDAAGLTLEAVALDQGRELARSSGPAARPLPLRSGAFLPWSPASPKLYDLRLTLRRGDQVLDTATSYFALRKTSLGKDAFGNTRLLLNNQPLFQMGPLDQGWWPDGLYTAPTDEALRFDIEFTKRLGHNLIRKHVKVEPARWYYHCDRLGILVWQDMPSAMLPPNQPNSLYVAPAAPADANRPADSARQFEAELEELIRTFQFFPSIVMWVVFNEGWGQYDVARLTDLTRQLDPSRLVNSTSGWTDRGLGDVLDVHHYPGPAGESDNPRRAMVLGEFGGVSMPVEGHLWAKDRNWGYATRTQKDELEKYYKSLFTNLAGLRAQGLSAAIYTQTTDVEIEVNGYLTYDRAIEKFDTAALAAFHQQFYAEPKTPARLLLPDARQGNVPWKYSFTKPAKDTKWLSGPGAFSNDTSNTFRRGVAWTEPEIWLQHSFRVDRLPKRLFLTFLNGIDEGEVVLNGQTIFTVGDLRPARRHHTHFEITNFLPALKKGNNLLEVRAKHTAPNRIVDLGLYGLD